MFDSEERYSKLKLIVSEVDGVITEGLINLDTLNNELYKSYFFKDFEAINIIKKHFNFVFLSANEKISYGVMRKRNIPFFYSNNKLKELSNIIRRYGVTPDEVMYVGSSYSDLECINLIPFSMCPSDAVTEVKIKSYEIINQFGGGGVICNLYEILKEEILKRIQKIT